MSLARGIFLAWNELSQGPSAKNACGYVAAAGCVQAQPSNYPNKAD